MIGVTASIPPPEMVRGGRVPRRERGLSPASPKGVGAASGDGGLTEAAPHAYIRPVHPE